MVWRISLTPGDSEILTVRALLLWRYELLAMSCLMCEQNYLSMDTRIMTAPFCQLHNGVIY